MKANPKQQEAINAVDGPLLILAGAGSGKTATLTQRIAHMISQGGVNPASILALTFTNKAAGEMKERTAQAIGAEYHPYMMKNRHLPYIGTFHSFGIFLLKDIFSSSMSETVAERIGIKKGFLIYDESDKLSIMKGIIKDDLGLIEKEYPPRQIAYFISDAKNKSINANTYKNIVDSYMKEIVAQAFELYEKKLRDNNALDFDDILGKTLEILQIPEILQHYQHIYKYIMVDEYQDTNMVQYEIIRLLAEKNKNLAVVGDDWQSIYSWRGADMRNILSFQKDYPDAKIVKLEQNYRSTSTIISAANALIKNNTSAMKKELWTDNTLGEKIEYSIASDDSQESEHVSSSIQEMVKEDAEYKDFLLLYRTNAQSRSLEEALMKKGIPYKVIGGQKFYDRKEIKDILAYLRCIQNPHDPVSFLRIINTPSRKIGAKTIETLTQYRENFGAGYFDVLENISELDDLRPAARVALEEFYNMYLSLKKFSLSNPLSFLISEIVGKIGYEEYIRSQYSGDEFESKRENLKELENVASEYQGIDPEESLSLFLEEVALITDLDKTSDEHDSVTLMTIHTSKGLEQRYVFLSGLEDGIFPHNRSLTNASELEEERRLMYVAMTRAKEKLFLSRSKQRFYFGDYVRNPESRFIKEISDEFMTTNELTNTGFSGFSSYNISSNFTSSEGESTTIIGKQTVRQNDVSLFRLGTRVSHHKFGQGIIESLVGEIAEIRFSSGIKRMNVRIAPIQIVS